MTKEELKEKLDILESEYDLKIRELYIQYAKDNNQVKVGDIIRDHIGFGRVESIRVYIKWNDEESEMKYVCTVLNKDGTKRKRGETTRFIYQCDIKQIININKD